MEQCKIGSYTIERDPDSALGLFVLYDDTGDWIDYWGDCGEMLMDIDNSPVGEAISLEEWQKLWDWANNQSLKQTEQAGHSESE